MCHKSRLGWLLIPSLSPPFSQLFTLNCLLHATLIIVRVYKYVLDRRAEATVKMRIYKLARNPLRIQDRRFRQSKYRAALALARLELISRVPISFAHTYTRTRHRGRRYTCAREILYRSRDVFNAREKRVRGRSEWEYRRAHVSEWLFRSPCASCISFFFCAHKSRQIALDTRWIDPFPMSEGNSRVSLFMKSVWDPSIGSEERRKREGARYLKRDYFRFDAFACAVWIYAAY